MRPAEHGSDTILYLSSLTTKFRLPMEHFNNCIAYLSRLSGMHLKEDLNIRKTMLESISSVSLVDCYPSLLDGSFGGVFSLLSNPHNLSAIYAHSESFCPRAVKISLNLFSRPIRHCSISIMNLIF